MYLICNLILFVYVAKSEEKEKEKSIERVSYSTIGMFVFHRNLELLLEFHSPKLQFLSIGIN